ncbi:MAG: hypothetical protein ABSG18_24265 [Steroidobacteraceae bacterium]|jgi:uncharacterized membrane protein YGL010W
MGPAQLVRWQWDGYFRYHGARTNLILHILAVPVFLAGNFTVLMALLRTSIYWITINIDVSRFPQQSPPPPK